MNVIALSSDELRKLLIKAWKKGASEPNVLNGAEFHADSTIRKLDFRKIESGDE